MCISKQSGVLGPNSAFVMCAVSPFNLLLMTAVDVKEGLETWRRDLGNKTRTFVRERGAVSPSADGFLREDVFLHQRFHSLRDVHVIAVAVP